MSSSVVNPYWFPSVPASLDFFEDFTDSQVVLDGRWQQSGTLCAPDAVSNNFTWTGKRYTTNEAMSHDLGGTVDDTAWVLRVSLNATDDVPATYSDYFIWGLYDTPNTTASVTTTSAVVGGLRTRSGSVAYGHRVYIDMRLNGSATNGKTASPQLGAPAPEIYLAGNGWYTGSYLYYELIRTSATTETIACYTDTGFSSLLPSSAVTSKVMDSSIINLQYIKFQNDNNTAYGVSSFYGTGGNSPTPPPSDQVGVGFKDGVTTY